jgi:hypothetical protein
MGFTKLQLHVGIDAELMLMMVEMEEGRERVEMEMRVS